MIHILLPQKIHQHLFKNSYIQIAPSKKTNIHSKIITYILLPQQRHRHLFKDN